MPYWVVCWFHWAQPGRAGCITQLFCLGGTLAPHRPMPRGAWLVKGQKTQKWGKRAGYLLGAPALWWCTGGRGQGASSEGYICNYGSYPSTPAVELLLEAGLGLSQLISKLPCCGRYITLGNRLLLFIASIPRKLHLISQMNLCNFSSQPLGFVKPFFQDCQISSLWPSCICLFRLW